MKRYWDTSALIDAFFDATVTRKGGLSNYSLGRFAPDRFARLRPVAVMPRQLRLAYQGAILRKTRFRIWMTREKRT